MKHLILAGCFDHVHGVKSNTERFDIISQASEILGFEVKEKDFPKDLIDKHYFWSMQQIDVSGIGSVDYERIYSNSQARNQLKGKVSYLSMQNALSLENEGRRAAVCATVLELEELSYKDKSSGEKKLFCKVVLQQNNDMMELIIWSDYYMANKALIAGMKNKVIIATAMIRYSEYTGTNSLNTFKTSLITEVQ